MTNTRTRTQAAGDLNEWMTGITNAIGSLSGELEEQLKQLKEKAAEKSHGKEKLEAVSAANSQLLEANITENKHTPLTLQQLRVAWDALEASIAAKEKLLEGEILAKQGSKVTSEQLSEFHESFKLFDKDGTGQLTPLQFKGTYKKKMSRMFIIYITFVMLMFCFFLSFFQVYCKAWVSIWRIRRWRSS